MDELSERELEILRLIATGASNKEIAQILFISTNTVKVHLRNIFTKICVTSRTEAAIFAIKAGLVPEGIASVEPVNDNSNLQVLDLPFEDFNVLGRRVKVPQYLRLSKTIWRTISLTALMFILVMVVVLSYSRGTKLASTEKLPTLSPRWHTLASMPIDRYGFGVVTFEDQIFVISGSTKEGVVSSVEKYDIVSDSWTSATSKPTAVTDIRAVVIGGKIYVPGGLLQSGDVINALEIYDPRLDQWARGADLPVAVSAYSLLSFEGKILLFGGWDGKKYLSTVFEYDPGSNKWKSKHSMPSARGYSGAALAGDKMYIIGGFDGKAPMNVNEIYEPSRDNEQEDPWSIGKTLPSGRYAMGVTSIADIVYVIGGEGKSESLSTMIEYRPKLDEWQRLESLILSNWSYFGLVPVEKELYVLGGKLNGKPTNQNLAYQAIYTILFPVVK